MTLYITETCCQNITAIHRPLAKASRWNLSKFVVIKHFGWESLNVQPSSCLDVVVYMLNCVFWRHILLEMDSYNTILNDYTWIKLKQSDNICVLLTWQLSWPTSRQKLQNMQIKNTYMQDNKQLFQIIGQIHGAMLLNINLFTLSCCY